MRVRHFWIPDVGGFFDLTDYETSGVRMMQGVEGLGNPGLDEFVRQPAMLDGQVFSGWRAAPREVFWPVLVGTNRHAWDAVQAAWWESLQPGKYGTWRVVKPDGSYRDLRVRFTAERAGAYTTDPSLRGLERHGISLIADDPWWCGEEVSQTFQAPADSLPFYATDDDRVFNLMPGNTVAEGELSNPGQLPAWPTYRLDGPATGVDVVGFGNWHVGGAFDVAEGEWLVIDSDPRVQTATLHHSEFYSENVTVDLEYAAFGAVPKGQTTNLDIQIDGSGSMTISFLPRYFRAF